MLLPMSRNKFEPWEIEDSKRLAELYLDMKERTGMTQQQFASRFGFGTQGNLGHYLKMRQPLNLEAVIKFSQGLECNIEDISPNLANLAKLAISRLEMPPASGWPFKAMTLDEYLRLQDEEKREIEGILQLKAEKVRPRKSSPTAA